MRNTGFEIRSSEIEALNKKFVELSVKIDKATADGLNKAGMRIMAEAQSNLKKDDSIATGKLINSGRVIDARKEGFVEVSFDANYATNVEFGQKAGTVVAIPILVEWLKKKNFIEGKGSKGYLSHLWAVATVISRNILARGTKARPFLYPAFRKNEDEVIKILQDAINRVV